MRRIEFCIFIVSLFLAAGLCFCDIENVFANENADEEQLSLKVYYESDSGEKLLKSFDAPALKAIAAAEGNQEYTYSSYNTYPTYMKVEKVTGPTVRGILNDALLNNTVDPDVDTVDGISNDWIIEFRAKDGVKEWFTKAQLFNEPRYYYPNADKEQGRCGQPVLPESLDGAVTEVPAVLSLTEKAGNEEAATHEDFEDVGRLLFGQTSPNEQNRAEFVKFMTSGGKIIIHPQNAASWNPITGIKSGNTKVPVGGITFDRDVNAFHTGDTPRYWIFYTYTTDGSEPEEPTNLSNMYNYNNFQFGGLYEGINKPVILAPGEQLTVKVKVWGYGRLDSDVKTLTFTGKSIPVPELNRAESVSANTIRLTWTKTDDVAGYRVYRSTDGGGSFEYLKTVRGDDRCTFDDVSCEPLVKYCYQVKAFTTYSEPGKSKEIIQEGDSSNKMWALASPTSSSINAPALTSAKRADYNTIQISWSRTDNAKGYQIYRSKGNANNFQLLNTITGNSALTYKDATCLTGAKYFYRVRAYTSALNADNGSEYTLYSNVSNYKYATATLTKPAIKTITAGKKKATVKWGKIKGANGYVIYRSVKKSKGYKAVKTIKKNGTISFINKKLKKGKRYYFKIRAYRTVSGKKVYSSYSAVKSVRVK